MQHGNLIVNPFQRFGGDVWMASHLLREMLELHKLVIIGGNVAGLSALFEFWTACAYFA